jgi:FKBP-type peptidyl-prolyl cis-trans isomerase
MPRAMFSTLLLLTLATAAQKPAPPPDLTTPPPEATRSSTGLIWRQLAPPAGTNMPADDDFVKLRFAMWSSDGTLKEFVAAPQWTVAGVGTLLPGLKEAIISMRSGEKRRLWINERLGAKGKVPPGGMLVADVELIDVIHPPTTPPDVGFPPPDATTLKSGLAYKVLRKGTGTRHPKGRDTVVVHYTGWQTSGHQIDSSVLRGEPSEFSLENVIAGWREGLQLLTEGERARLWIPEKLAYKGEPGKPQGMLVFDVELIKIK